MVACDTCESMEYCFEAYMCMQKVLAQKFGLEKDEEEEEPFVYPELADEGTEVIDEETIKSIPDLPQEFFKTVIKG